MLAVDTNVVVRFLTGDDPAQAERARAVFEREAVLLLKTVMLANTIRIGTQGTQTATYIAGVSGILSGASESTELAVNTTTGQVGVIPSSVRFKRDIHDMGGASTDLMKLRPVTFRYKQDS